MSDKKHTAVTFIFSGISLATVLILAGFVWNASAKNTKFEAACERLIVMDKVDNEHTASIASLNTTVAVLTTNINTILENQKELKDDFLSFRKEWRLRTPGLASDVTVK